MRTAVCFAGAWRDWPASWSHILHNIIEPLGIVDIYAVSDTTRNGAHGISDTKFTVERMQEIFGARFKNGEQLTAEHMANVSGHTWPTITSVQAALPRHSSVFAYLYKIWRCGQLIQESHISYDVVIRLRPDLWPTQPLRIQRVTGGDEGEYELQVGGRCVRFGTRSVVIHAYTNYCANDWLAIGGLKAMIVTMDLLRFWTPASGFLSPDEALDKTFSRSVEMAHNWLWWRTGTTVHRHPLFLELSRRRCLRSSCLRMPAWQILQQQQQRHQQDDQLGGLPVLNGSSCLVFPDAINKPPIGAMQPGRHGLVNDCGAPGGKPMDLEWFTGPIESRSASPTSSSLRTARTSLLPFHQASLRGRVKRTMSIEPPRTLAVATTLGWTRPACTDVPDLSVSDPLMPCRKLTGDESSYAPEAHRPKVLHGYGTAHCFQCATTRAVPALSVSSMVASAPSPTPSQGVLGAAAQAAHDAIMAEMNTQNVSSDAARANVGDVERLRWNLRRCFASNGQASTLRPTLRVLVVGCSMTQGFMNCGTTIEGKQCTVPCDAIAWYRVLGQYLQRGLPGCRVATTRSTSRGGRTVTTAQRYDTRVKRYAPHIVITDLTVCDLRGVTSSLDGVRVQAGMETLIRRILAEATLPALLHMESWAELNPMGNCKDGSAHRLHLPIAKRYGVPVASFMLGVCAYHPESALRRHWKGGCSQKASSCGALDVDGSECEPHPGPHTHKIFALIVAEQILAEANVAARLPFTLPPSPLNETQVDTILPASALASLAACRAHHGTGNPTATLDFAEGTCASPIQSSGWRCYSDRPGKPGWITEAPLAAGELSFELPLPSSKLTVGFLRSYDARMGAARVWLDDDIESGVVLNGSWPSRTSQTDLVVLHSSEICKSSCLNVPRGAKHHVHVQRVAGQKFKLLSLEVC